MIKRILVGLGGTEYTPIAIRRAVELAQLHEAELTGVTVIDPRRLSVGPVPAGAGQTARELREHLQSVTLQNIEHAVAAFEDACKEKNVRCRVAREEGNAFSFVVSQARYHDLTVFGLRSVFEYYFEDTDSSEVLARLVGEGVRPILAVSSEYRPIRRVVMAYSGSMPSARTIRRFVQLRLWPHMTLRIVSCGADAQELEKNLHDMAEYCRIHGFDAELKTLAGQPQTELLRHLAEWDADLMVLGNSLRSFLSRRVFGETAVHVIRNAQRPLFLSC